MPSSVSQSSGRLGRQRQPTMGDWVGGRSCVGGAIVLDLTKHSNRTVEAAQIRHTNPAGQTIGRKSIRENSH